MRRRVVYIELDVIPFARVTLGVVPRRVRFLLLDPGRVSLDLVTRLRANGDGSPVKSSVYLTGRAGR